jgi:hypothetical protein
MLTILVFNFLYHKFQFCFVCHVHYTPFTCGKGLLNSNILKHTLKFSNFQTSQI